MTTAQTVLSELSTFPERAKASEKAITHGLSSGTSTDSISLAQLLKNETKNITVQDLYAQQLIGFYNHATTHFHRDTKNSMLEDFKKGKRIDWEHYVLVK